MAGGKIYKTNQRKMSGEKKRNQQIERRVIASAQTGKHDYKRKNYLTQLYKMLDTLKHFYTALFLKMSTIRLIKSMKSFDMQR